MSGASILDTYEITRSLSSWSLTLPGGFQAISLEDLLGTNFLSKIKHLPTGHPAPKLASGEELRGEPSSEEELTPRPGGTVGRPLRACKGRRATHRNLCY